MSKRFTNPYLVNQELYFEQSTTSVRFISPDPNQNPSNNNPKPGTLALQQNLALNLLCTLQSVMKNLVRH